MPVLPLNSLTRRKGATPCKKLQQDDVWSRSLYVLGLEEMTVAANSPKTISTSNSTSTSASASATPTPAMEERTDSPPLPVVRPANPGKKLTFMDLPLETKQGIFKHASSADLIALSLVSKHFRDLASGELYRTFHILFPDEDDPTHEYPFDSLAGGLDTFVTSDYNYAQYLKEFIMEAQSGGGKGERAYRHYLFDVSCGKFMNTLMLLTLRKAKALETFRWDIRVELSRPVFKALHQIQALQHLHLRMQSGPSIYQPLPPLPTSVLPPAHGVADSVDGSALAPLPPILPVPAGSPNSFPFGNKIAKICQMPPVASPEVRPTPPTVSGFKNLKTLTILDMDTLEYIDELRDCIRNSSGTLSSLQLSFSDGLANRSRKPQPDPQSDDDSDVEDEFGQLIPPPGPPMGNQSLGASDLNIPLKIMKSQEERKQQEAALGRIFGLENITPKPKAPVVLKPESEKPKSEEDPRRRFIKNLAPVAAKLMAHVKPGSDISTEGKATLELIEKAAQTYLDSMDKSREKNMTSSAASSTSKATHTSSSASTHEPATENAVMSGAAESDGPGLFDEPEKKKKSSSDESGVSNPDDINVEEPEGKELVIEFDPVVPEAAPEEPPATQLSEPIVEEVPEAAAPAALTIEMTKQELAIMMTNEAIEIEGEKLLEKMKEFREKLECTNLTDADKHALLAADGPLKIVSQRVSQLTTNMRRIGDHLEELQDRSQVMNYTQMNDYVRDTRGLTLESFSLYMIPLKASVLSRAIDLHVLQSVALLNVGPQTAFWNLMSRENKLHSLPLHKIHTDNVTLSFLLFVAQLDTMTELIMMEKVNKDRSENAVAKTTITIEQIRKIVLKKHASTLKVLVIRNDTIGMDWDLNIKTAMLLCERAKNLVELACSFGSRTMHTLLQYMPGLTSLRVLHTIAFHNINDTCSFVMHEFRKFCVDNVSHNPGMKLEYLALDQTVERLVRRKPMPKPKVDKKGKGKELDWTSAKALAELVMGSNAVTASAGWGDESKYDFPDSSDDEDGIVKTGLRVETIDGIRFSDVIGVRIFERDVVTGKL